jgi:hypothetical protein
MKTKQINTVVRLFFVLPFLYAAFATQAQINLSLTPVDGECASDCQIIASATGTTGSVTYSLIHYPVVGQNSPTQTSGLFTGLQQGTYTVGVYDATTAGTPVMKSVSVKTNYVPLLANPLVFHTNIVGAILHGTKLYDVRLAVGYDILPQRRRNRRGLLREFAGRQNVCHGNRISRS